MSARVALVPAELAELDRAFDELLVAAVFQDERPLRGLAGLCDWRLCGRLARLYLGGFASGELGERVLRPTGGRLPHRAVLLMGLGARGGFGLERACQVAASAWEAAQGLGVRSVTCELFGAGALPDAPERKVRALLGTLGQAPCLEQVTLLADPVHYPAAVAWQGRPENGRLR